MVNSELGVALGHLGQLVSAFKYTYSGEVLYASSRCIISRQQSCALVDFVLFYPELNVVLSLLTILITCICTFIFLLHLWMAESTDCIFQQMA
jgi:hypothetical protein